MSESVRTLLEDHSLVLAEAAVVEPLRRAGRVTLDPRLVHAPLIYDRRGRDELAGIYRRYVDIATACGLPLLLCTPTWRANRERVLESGLPGTINADAVRFLRELREERSGARPPLPVGGLIGCRHDCYRPDQGLTAAEAESFHRWQAERLAAAGSDFLIAETLPAVEEAAGIARALAATGCDYFVSFVIGRDGRVLDGSALADAVRRIDGEASPPPLGYMVNCAHPSFLRAGEQPAELFERLVGYLANASSLDHCDLDGAAELHADDIAGWSEQMLELNRRFGVKVLGGCCGTGAAHLEALAGRRSG